MQAITAIVSMGFQKPCHAQRTLFLSWSSQPLALKIFLLLVHHAPQVLGVGSMMSYLWLSIPQTLILCTFTSYENACKPKLKTHPKDQPLWSCWLRSGMQGWHNIRKSVSVVHHINGLKDRYHKSINAENAFDKIQQCFMIKTLEKLGVEGTYINKIKVIHDQQIVTVILNEEKLFL